MQGYAGSVQATKTLVVASEQGYTNFVCTCLQIQFPTELNQKFTKSMPRFGAFTQKNAYVKNLGLKRWEGICPKGTYFWETYSTCIHLAP